MFYLYIIQSEADKSFYVGYTNNLILRLQEHEFGKHKYTSKKKPWKLVYKEEYPTKTEAIKREKYIKRMKSRTYIESLVSKGL